MNAIKEAYNAQIKNEVKAEIKWLQQQNRYNRQRIKELKNRLKGVSDGYCYF